MSELQLPNKGWIKDEAYSIAQVAKGWEFYNLPVPLFDAYMDRLSFHLAYVKWFGRQLHVPSLQLALHDSSKFSRAEFTPYALYFCDAIKKEYEPGFAAAWIHHIGHNPHHWEHWCLPDTCDFGGVVGRCVQMPNEYVLEMVADWLAASYQHTGSIDMTQWLEEHLPVIDLHPVSFDYLKTVLVHQLDYGHVKALTHDNHRQIDDGSIEDMIASFAQQVRDGSISGEEAADALRGNKKEKQMSKTTAPTIEDWKQMNIAFSESFISALDQMRETMIKLNEAIDRLPDNILTDVRRLDKLNSVYINPTFLTNYRPTVGDELTVVYGNESHRYRVVDQSHEFSEGLSVATLGYEPLPDEDELDD